MAISHSDGLMNTRLQAITSAGRTLSFDLPTDQVFEDLAPRLVKLNEISVPARLGRQRLPVNCLK